LAHITTGVSNKLVDFKVGHAAQQTFVTQPLFDDGYEAAQGVADLLVGVGCVLGSVGQNFFHSDFACEFLVVRHLGVGFLLDRLVAVVQLIHCFGVSAS